MDGENVKNITWGAIFVVYILPRYIVRPARLGFLLQREREAAGFLEKPELPTKCDAPPVSDTSLLEMKMSADSTSWGSTEHEYDVFFSFRGSDTRKGIADQVHPMGSQFGLQLLHAIARCKISIPIVSESYAASEWCLRELVQMVESRYFEQRDVEAGQQALRDVSFLKGWESEKLANGPLGEFVRIVVETVLSELRQGFRVDVPETLVGIDDHMKKIIGWLDTTSNRIRTIGIYGIGGIGKITFTFGEFVHCSFFPDIHERTEDSSR